MKRWISLLIACILVLTASTAVIGAKGVDDFAMVKMNMPDVVAELKGTDHGISDASSVTAYYGDDKLTVDYARAYDASKDSSLVYLMVDASLTNERFLPLIKDCLKYYVGKIGENDAVRVVKFGEKVDFLLDGSENTDQIKKIIDSIKCDEKDTVLYTALDEVYKDASEVMDQYTRVYAIVFSDCENDIIVGVTAAEVKDEYSSHMLPLYVCAPPDSQQSGIDAMGKIARASGGNITTVSAEGEFKAIVKDINDVTMLGLSASNNNTSGKKTLSVKINDAKTYNVDVAAQYSKTDSTAPEVIDIHYDEQNSRFIIDFSENVVGASDRGAYAVTDADGKRWTVINAEALETATSVQIEMEQPIPSGNYTITFSGITDASMEKNPLTDTATITIDTFTPAPDDTGTNDIDIQDEKQPAPPVWLWIVIGAGVLLIAALVVFLLLRAKNKKDEDAYGELPAAHYVPTVSQPAPVEPVEAPPEWVEAAPAPPAPVPVDDELVQQPEPVVKHHVMKDSVRVSLHVRTGNVSEQNIEATIVSSVIVGRSSVCDIYIDDTKLSRQHFVIENINRELFISDMESKNGTFLNGSKISTRRKIVNGDKILAGLSEITIRIL